MFVAPSPPPGSGSTDLMESGSTGPIISVSGSELLILDGQIQLILGPMFSGKSTELIRRLKRYEVAQYKVLIVKYAKVST